MELSVTVNAPNAQNQVGYLKNYIDTEGINGVEKSEVETSGHIAGTQGFDVLNSVKVIIEAAEKPLVELVTCLQKYVDNYRSDVTISNAKGASLKINMGRSMDQDTLKTIIQMFLTS